MRICICVCVCFFQVRKHKEQRPKKLLQSEDSPPGTRVGKSGQEQTGVLPCPEINLCPWSLASNQSKRK